MFRDDVRPRWRALCLFVLFATSSGACQGDNGNPVGPICPNCGPSTGGETGDFGGVTVLCEGLVSGTLDEAQADGFDVSEFERRLTRAIDAPMRWRRLDEYSESATRREVPVSGYQVATRIQATLSLTSAFRYTRSNQSPCGDGHCPRCNSVEVDLRIELQTLDGAVQAATRGTAVQTWGLKDLSAPPDPYFIYFNSSADLRDVVGTLRVAPPGKASFHGRLAFSAFLHPDNAVGQLSIPVEVDRDDPDPAAVSWVEGEYAFPLYGEFPSVVWPPAER